MGQLCFVLNRQSLKAAGVLDHSTDSRKADRRKTLRAHGDGPDVGVRWRGQERRPVGLAVSGLDREIADVHAEKTGDSDQARVARLSALSCLQPGQVRG